MYGSRRRITNGYGFREDLLHPVIGSGRLALLDAYGGKCAENFGTVCLVRLILDDAIHFFIKMKVVRVNGIEFLAGNVDELHGRWIIRVGQPIHLGEFLGTFYGRPGAAVLKNPARTLSCHMSRNAGRIALRNVALVIGRQQQEFAALALSGPTLPKSATYWNQWSSIIPSTLGGVSITTGPSLVSTHIML